MKSTVVRLRVLRCLVTLMNSRGKSSSCVDDPLPDDIPLAPSPSPGPVPFSPMEPRPAAEEEWPV